MIEVIRPGVLTSLQDQGRRGYESFGLPPSGAFDPFLARVANRLVGNPSAAAVLEFALIGPDLFFHDDCRVAIAGHEIEYGCDQGAVLSYCAFSVSSGSPLKFVKSKGWFGYIAFQGGIAVERVLDSASTYAPGSIGTQIKKGAFLNTGPGSDSGYSIDPKTLGVDGPGTLTALPAMHTTLFEFEEQNKMFEQEFRITTQSNRMGIRMEGNALKPPEVRRSVPSVPGAIQVPPSGMPILLGPEGPTTGGYPQIAIIDRCSWTRLAAVQPGSGIRFERGTVEESRRKWQYRERIFQDEASWKRI